MKYDFSGYATRNDVVCADGRVIRKDAFKNNDGGRVPLVWQHLHDSPSTVIGHADLENRPDGVYARCSLNETSLGKDAKIIVNHDDVRSLSIYANQLKQRGSEVVHGIIREVSLVLAGANPGAHIDNLSFAHSDGFEEISEEDAFMFFDQPISRIMHAEEDAEEDEEKKEEKSDMAEKNQNGSSDDKTVEDVMNTLTEEQMNAVAFIIGSILEDEGDEDEEVEIDEEEIVEEGNDQTMKHNVFMDYGSDDTIIHSEEIAAAFADAPNMGTLKNAFIKHGIEDIEILFPEAKTVTPTPEMISRNMDWVAKVWNAIKKSPFARIKSTAADLTENDARAKGYVKGTEKVDEQISLLKRVTTPQMVYKKQSLDREDVISITDMDVLAWIKAEMRMMLDEELSRAVLVGDGRLASSADKIKPDNIRPIYGDDPMYTIYYDVELPTDGDATDRSNALVDSAVRARKDYKGSGNPSFYASVDVINDMLLARDKMGRRMYGTMTELADALRVSEIVEVPVMENMKRTVDGGERQLLGIIVNLTDYTVGTDRGGEISFFSNFDIDYNKEKYLFETMCSGALTKPYSAIALELPAASGAAEVRSFG